MKDTRVAEDYAKRFHKEIETALLNLLRRPILNLNFNRNFNFNFNFKIEASSAVKSLA
jgi:hypothetical protein